MLNVIRKGYEELLPVSGVQFFEERHEYWLGFDLLTGVTSLMKQVLYADKYAGIDADVLARAAERGNAIHEAVQAACMYSTLAGISAESDRAAEMAPDNCQIIAAEYLISNNKDIASKIDMVEVTDEGIRLIDIKCTRDYDAEYLSWQLSIYAELFEAQTGLKVASLECWHWTKSGKWEMHDVRRKSRDEVLSLIEDWRAGVTRPMPQNEAEVPAVLIDLAEWYADAQRKMDEAKQSVEEFRQRMLDAMKEAGVKQVKVEGATFSLIPATERVSFDSARFKAEHAEMYSQYEKTAQVKETIKITLTKK